MVDLLWEELCRVLLGARLFGWVAGGSHWLLSTVRENYPLTWSIPPSLTFLEIDCYTPL